MKPAADLQDRAVRRERNSQGRKVWARRNLAASKTEYRLHEKTTV
jgi:hypothetical protein